ncbi:MAG: alkyl sulfatase C-terminal domain-containing protein [Mycobacteriales bacterium]
MATVEECEKALRDLATRLADVDPDVRRRHSVDRSVSATITDLDAVFSGRLQDGALVDVVEGDDPDAQIRLTLTSDDLLAVTSGQQNFAMAWAVGRIRIEASVLDLLRLRSLW